MNPTPPSPVDSVCLRAGAGYGVPPVHPSTKVPDSWHPISLADRLAIFLTLGVVTLAAVPRLPTGVCHADSGGFQLAAATLGITHPPGYAGYVTFWHLLTRICSADPAYVVAVSCLVAGLGVLGLLILFQIRLGVNVWMACAVSLLFTAHPRVWSNLLAPEIYMLSLLLVCTSAYLLWRYDRLGRRIDLYIAAFFYGVAIANRLPYILLLPFVLAVWWMARRKWEKGSARGLRTISLCAALALVPLVYNIAYLWILDRPDTPYNYLESYNTDTNELPLSTDGPRAKWRRVIWLQGGEQFRDLLIWQPRREPAEDNVEFKVRQVYAKSRWIAQDLLPDPSMTLGLLWAVVAVAASALRRRARVVSVALTTLSLTAVLLYLASQFLPALAESLVYPLLATGTFAGVLLHITLLVAMVAVVMRYPVPGILLLGLATGAIVYVTIYRIHGLAADMLPLLFVVAVLLGVIFSVVFPSSCSRRRATAAAIIMLLLALVTLVSAPSRRSLGRDEDAAEFLAAVDLPTLPRDAVICTSWGMATPLWYVSLVQSPRPDIHIVNAPTSAWQRLTRDLMHRPIYVTDDIIDTTIWPGATWQKERNLWRMVRSTGGSDASTGM